MKTIAIHISGGNLQGIYEVLNAPQKQQGRYIVIDDDNLAEVSLEERHREANRQLEGFEADGYINFDELHDSLSNYISSDDVNSPMDY